MSYETLNEEPLYLTGQDASFVRNLLKDPAGFLDEFTDHSKLWMKRPKNMLGYGAIQPVTFGQAGTPGTLSGDWVNRFEAYADAKARGDRQAAFAAISAEIKSANGNGNVALAPLQLSPCDIGALAVGVANTRRETYRDLAIAAGVPTTVLNGEGREIPRSDRDIAKDFRVVVGQPIPFIKGTTSAIGAPINFGPAQEICTEDHLRNVHSISASMNAETNQTEFHIPIPAAMKLVGQSMLQKDEEVAFYHAPKEVPMVPISAPAVKALENHINEVAKSGSIVAIDAAKIGEHMCNDATKCNGEAKFDKLFVGQKQEIGTSLNDVISAVYNVFPVGSESPFSEKSEAKLREAIGASQGALVTAKNAPKQSSVSYEMFVGANFLPAVGYHMEAPSKMLKKNKGVFEHDVIGEHYAEHPAAHAVISAKMQDGTTIDTLIVPVSAGVKIIGDHVHGGSKDGKHRKRRGHTAYSEKKDYMGMLYN